ncbi:hypothetical protein GCM10028807_48430 [Spirosoma daeguense]
METLYFPLTILVLMIVHESGHVGAAKLLGLRVTSIGFEMKPIPHPAVAIKWSTDRPKVLTFFLAGITMTTLQFGFMLTNRFFDQPMIYFAFCAQLILETNPFYSDFTLAQRFLEYPRRTVYTFSLAWYIHISLWTALIVILLSKRYLYGLLFFSN